MSYPVEICHYIFDDWSELALTDVSEYLICDDICCETGENDCKTSYTGIYLTVDFYCLKYLNKTSSFAVDCVEGSKQSG